VSDDVVGALGGLLAALGAQEWPGQTGEGGQAGSFPVQELRGVGEAASGQVRAEVSAGSRLESLRIEPGLLRAGHISVADVVVEAVQAAQDDAAAKAAVLGEGAVPSSAQLTAAVQAAQTGTDRLETMLAELSRIGDRLGGPDTATGPTSRGRGW
jgi:hypothetical protein